MLDIKVKEILKNTGAGYEKIAEEFSATREELWPELYKFRQYVKEGDKILDAGCGNGRLIKIFKGLEVDYLGIDSSPKLIYLARKKFPQAKFEIGDILDLEVSKSSFDVVFCIAVLHHLPQHHLRLRALGNLKEVLKKDGYLIISVWDLWRWQNAKVIFQSILNWLLRKGSSPKDFFIPWHTKKGEKIQRYYYAFTKNELKKLIRKSSLRIEAVFQSKRKQRNIYVVCRK